MIMHEYGHAIQDARSRGFGTQLRQATARSARASATTGPPRCPSARRGPTNADDVCIFDWDGDRLRRKFPAVRRSVGRSAAGARTSSGPCQGQAEQSCRTTSTASARSGRAPCWDLRTELGDRRAGRMDSDRARRPVHATTRNERFDDAVDGAGATPIRTLYRRHASGRDLHRDGGRPGLTGRAPAPESGPEKDDPPASGRGNTGGSLGSDWPTFTRRGGVGGVPDGWVVSSNAETIGAV